MSISAMKQALEALEWKESYLRRLTWKHESVTEAAKALRQAIAEAEKQEPVAIGEEWKPCVKLPIIVHVREQRKGETHVSTREGITPVKEDDLIMRGVAGEEYPIGRELFNRTYTFDTAPVHASDISQERVDETAKCGHEPVAWREVAGKTTHYYEYNEQGRGQPLYAAPVAQCYYPGCQTTSGCVGACSKTAPTAWAEITKEYVAVSDEPFENATPLYTKREWVGLTDEEMKEAMEYWSDPVRSTYGGAKMADGEYVNMVDTWRYIEAKLKEKNT